MGSGVTCDFATTSDRGILQRAHDTLDEEIAKTPVISSGWPSLEPQVEEAAVILKSPPVLSLTTAEGRPPAWRPLKTFLWASCSTPGYAGVTSPNGESSLVESQDGAQARAQAQGGRRRLKFRS